MKIPRGEFSGGGAKTGGEHRGGNFRGGKTLAPIVHRLVFDMFLMCSKNP